MGEAKWTGAEQGKSDSRRLSKTRTLLPFERKRESNHNIWQNDSAHTARSEFTANRSTRAAAPAQAPDIQTGTHTPQADSGQHTHATSGRKSSREHIPCPMSQLKLTDERTLQEPVPAVAQNQQGMLQLRPENQIAAPLPLSKRKHTKNHKGRTSIGASRSTSRKIRSREWRLDQRTGRTELTAREQV
jgi:hypothetical protein